MDLGTFPVGDVASVNVTLAGGQAVITIKVATQAEADKLLEHFKSEVPALIQPLISGVEAAVDKAMS